MNEDLKIIKKNYGEKMAHLCRELFSSLLEEEGLLPKLLLSKFAPTRSLYEDIMKQEYEEQFKDYIYSFIDVEKKETKVQKTVKELLSEAGYDFYECSSEKDIQAFKKYYANGEALCTFKGNRLNRCHVFWAVKKDVDNIKRENFFNPKRQDKYGTSVISIQFIRGNINTLSIKNRYNHRVNNPDATFSNNLENIIPGLTDAFQREYGFKINQTEKQDFELYQYIMGNDKKYYRWNYEMNNIYYCENNVIVANGEVIELDKSRYLLIDYFIIDLKEKNIKLFDIDIKDSFINNFTNINKIELENEKETNNKIIKIELKDKEDTIIKIDKFGQIIELSDSNITSIENNFLRYNKTLKKIKLPNVEEIGNNFLRNNYKLEQLQILKLKHAGIDFLSNNNDLEEINLPNLEEASTNFIQKNKIIKKINLPKLRKVKMTFLSNNTELEELDLPNLEEVEYGFIYFNKKIKKINLPNLRKIGDSFLGSNCDLEEINLPNLEEVGDNFISYNKKIKKLSLPKLRYTGHSFLKDNNKIEELELLNLEKAGSCFIYENKKIKKINLPKLKIEDGYFLHSTEDLEEINLPNLEEVGDNFLRHNKKTKRLYFPKLKIIGEKFLEKTIELEELILPNVEEVGNRFMQLCFIKKVDMPKLKKTGISFLEISAEFNKLQDINLPNLKEIASNNSDIFHKIVAINKKGGQNEEIKNNRNK